MRLKKSNRELKCKYFRVQEDVIEKVKDNLPSDGEFRGLIELFKSFTDEIKLKIIYILFDSEVCVCELGELLKISEDEVISHLKELEELRVVKHKQEEDMTCYYLANNHIQYILVEGCIHKSYID
jgi:ArsR family transcriptional regulator